LTDLEQLVYTARVNTYSNPAGVQLALLMPKKLVVQPPRSIADLDRLEQEALRFIADYSGTDPFRRPPSQAELLAHLNQVLPRRPGNKPALVSTQQTHRLATRMRSRGLLVDITGFVRVPRNMVLTELGEQLARDMRAHRSNDPPL
jgi:hypothetical protein